MSVLETCRGVFAEAAVEFNDVRMLAIEGPAGVQDSESLLGWLEDTALDVRAITDFADLSRRHLVGRALSTWPCLQNHATKMCRQTRVASTSLRTLGATSENSYGGKIGSGPIDGLGRRVKLPITSQ